jgi:hypothetical protein
MLLAVTAGWVLKPVAPYIGRILCAKTSNKTMRRFILDEK